jgi:hypothetical protein
MMDDFNVWGVNWIDGMLVTSVHLNQQEDFALNLSRWVATHLAGGYGIAKPAGSRNEPLEIKLRHEGNLAYVTVARCVAVLPNGTPVQINDQFGEFRVVELKIDLTKETRERLPIYLYASPSEKTTFGDPLSGEQLSRLPFQVPRLILSVGPSQALSVTSGFQIAELQRSGNDYEINSNFVPAILFTTCGKAVSIRMERLRKIIDEIQRVGLAAIAEVRAKTKSRPSASEEENNRGIFLQTETLLHHIGYNYNQLFDGFAGVSSRTLINCIAGLVGGFQQGFLIYPELREYVRNAQLTTDGGTTSGGTVLPELRDYQTRDYGLDQMTQFFDDSEKTLKYIASILSYYASGAAGRATDSIERDGFRFQLQHHGAVKYSFRNNRHNIIIDGVDPRGTEDVILRLDKKVLPIQYAGNVIIYLGANEVDDIAAASVARKPVDDATNPDYWLIQPNEYFPLKCSRLDRLNVIIDGQVDRAALEAVKMNHVVIFSRSR